VCNNNNYDNNFYDDDDNNDNNCSNKVAGVSSGMGFSHVQVIGVCFLAVIAICTVRVFPG